MKNPASVRMILITALCVIAMAADARQVSTDPQVSVITDPSPGIVVLHGLKKLSHALSARGIAVETITSPEGATGEWLIIVGSAQGNGYASKIVKEQKHPVPQISEGLAVWKTRLGNKPAWVISGFDDRGTMYALLDVAKRIGWSQGRDAMSEVFDISEKPYVSERAVSVFTMNRRYWESRFYNEAYWSRYLDMLAENRFNSFVLIFGYENGGFLAPPYPYFFDVETHPDVKMVGVTPEEQARNLSALNRLIEMAHERGISFTVGIWDHIYRGGVQGGGIPGTKDAPDRPVPGLVWGVNAGNLIDYNKTALARFVKLVPDVDRIQFRMHNESGLQAGEQDAFWLDVFRMIKETAPHLRLDLRAKELPPSVIESALNVGVNFRITTKYWMEQMGMPYHPTRTNPEPSPIRHSYAYLLRYPQKYKMHWRLWNGGTSRILLWGDPEYVRRFAASTHLYDGDGFEVNEPLATKMEAQPHDAEPFDLLNEPYRYYEWEFERYWHFFQVFGRVGFNPETSADIWKKEFAARLGEKAAPFVEAALHKASWILPRIITSVYPYRGFPMTRGWAEKQRLGNLPAYAKNEGSDIRQFANFDEEALMLIEGGETPRILPSVNSQWFQRSSDEINELISRAEKAAGDKPGKEFVSVVTDLKILSNLARFHARRIPAAVSFRIFERTNNVAALDDAITHEKNAIQAWRELVAATGDVYTDNLMMGVCNADLCGHWKDELVALERGLELLEKGRKGVTSQPGTRDIRYSPVPATFNPDKLFGITHTPVTTAPTGKPITISAKVRAQAGVKWVRLRYRSVNQDLEYETLPMNQGKVKGTYEATIAADRINPEYDLMYFIEVMDNNRHGRIYPDLNKETPYLFVKLLR